MFFQGLHDDLCNALLNEISNTKKKPGRGVYRMWEEIGTPIIFHGVIGEERRDPKSLSMWNREEISKVSRPIFGQKILALKNWSLIFPCFILFLGCRLCFKIALLWNLRTAWRYRRNCSVFSSGKQINFPGWGSVSHEQIT